MSWDPCTLGGASADLLGRCRVWGGIAILRARHMSGRLSGHSWPPLMTDVHGAEQRHSCIPLQEASKGLGTLPRWGK